MSKYPHYRGWPIPKTREQALPAGKGPSSGQKPKSVVSGRYVCCNKDDDTLHRVILGQAKENALVARGLDPAGFFERQHLTLMRQGGQLIIVARTNREGQIECSSEASEEVRRQSKEKNLTSATTTAISRLMGRFQP